MGGRKLTGDLLELAPRPGKARGHGRCDGLHLAALAVEVGDDAVVLGRALGDALDGAFGKFGPQAGDVCEGDTERRGEDEDDGLHGGTILDWPLAMEFESNSQIS